MSHPRLRVAVLTLFVVAVAACSSTSSKSTESTVEESTTSVGSSTTVSSDGATSVVTTTATTVAATASATTKPPTATTTKATVATTAAPSGPKVATFSVSNPFACIAPDVSFDPPPNMVTVSWNATGADSVYVAIDNPEGPWETGLPVTGSIDIPFACPGPHSYYVVAVKGTQKDVRAKQVSG